MENVFACHDFETTRTLRATSSCFSMIHRCIRPEPVLKGMVSEKLRKFLAGCCTGLAVNSGYRFLAMCHLVNCFAGLQQMHHWNWRISSCYRQSLAARKRYQRRSFTFHHHHHHHQIPPPLNQTLRFLNTLKTVGGKATLTGRGNIINNIF